MGKDENIVSIVVSNIGTSIAALSKWISFAGGDLDINIFICIFRPCSPFPLNSPKRGQMLKTLPTNFIFGSICQNCVISLYYIGLLCVLDLGLCVLEQCDLGALQREHARESC